MKVETVPHNPEWKELYEREKDLLSNIFAENLITVFHIGSTSVPGLSAKPIIDIMPVVRNIRSADIYSEELSGLGYEALGEYGIVGRRYFRKEKDGIRTHHVHVYELSDLSNILRHVAFRDYLCSNDKAKNDYAVLKQKSAEAHPYDIEAYMDAKDAFVKEIEKISIEYLLKKF